MKENTKIALIIVVLVIVFSIVGRQIFKIMELSIKDTKPFVYTDDNLKRQRFFNWIIPMVKVIGAKYNLPWQALAVQTALESGWGKSSLLRRYNNFGGIKSVSGDNSVSLGTQEFVNGQYITINDGFAVWKTPFDGVNGYGHFFHKNQRYKNALKYPKDPYKFIEEIKKAGYATDPDYVAKLHGMLNKYFK